MTYRTFTQRLAAEYATWKTSQHVKELVDDRRIDRNLYWIAVREHDRHDGAEKAEDRLWLAIRSSAG